MFWSDSAFLKRKEISQHFVSCYLPSPSVFPLSDQPSRALDTATHAEMSTLNPNPPGILTLITSQHATTGARQRAEDWGVRRGGSGSSLPHQAAGRHHPATDVFGARLLPPTASTREVGCRGSRPPLVASAAPARDRTLWWRRVSRREWRR